MSKTMDKKALGRIVSAGVKKTGGQIQKASKLSKLQSRIDKKTHQGNKK